MTEIIRLRQGQSWPGGIPLPLEELPALVATAGRAPSVLNTQPWQFRVSGHALEMHADVRRGLRVLDPVGREMLISCGAALYGLRLAVRQLGYVPAVGLLPDPGRPGLLARLYLGTESPITPAEQDLLAVVPHRYTHRGPFSPGPLPAGLLTGLRQDAAAEGAALAMVDEPAAYPRPARLAGTARALPGSIGKSAFYGHHPRSTPPSRAFLRGQASGSDSSSQAPAPCRVRPAGWRRYDEVP